jgi:hypothetical protein
MRKFADHMDIIQNAIFTTTHKRATPYFDLPLPLSFGNDSEAAADLWERYLNVDFDGVPLSSLLRS